MSSQYENEKIIHVNTHVSNDESVGEDIDHDPDQSDLLAKSAAGATLLMLGQLFTKFITFILNQLLIRYITPRVFGVSAFLEFLLSTVLFFSREGERLAIQRIGGGANGNKDDAIHKKNDFDGISKENVFIKGTVSGTVQSVINFSYVSLAIGIPLSVILFPLQYKNISNEIRSLDFFQLATWLLWLSTIVELIGEPSYALNQYHLNFKVRTKFESISVVVRCLVNFSIVIYFKKDMTEDPTHQFNDGLAILAFAFGQLSYSLSIGMLYIWNFLSENSKLKTKNTYFLSKIYNSPISKEYTYIDKDIFTHWWSILGQLVFKHVLTEGDKFLINLLCTIEEQGIYSLIGNYGSLLARLIFAQIEETLRLGLSRLLVNKTNKNLVQSLSIVTQMSNLYLHMSILILIGGIFNSSFLLSLLIGNKWNSTNVLDIIPYYVLYIPFLAFNGILEAFVQSSAKNTQLVNHSIYMGIFSAIFILTAYILLDKFHLSLIGLIMSNIMNMCLRILYCYSFIVKFYKFYHIALSGVGKQSKRILAISVVFGMVQWKLLGFTDSFRGLFKSIGLILVLVIIMIYNEREIIIPFLQSQGRRLNKRS